MDDNATRRHSRSRREQRAVASSSVPRPASYFPRQGTAGVARHGPAGARDAYDQQVYAPNRDQVGKRRIANSEKVRAIIGAPERVAYGPTEIEKADIYRTKRPVRRSTSSSTAVPGVPTAPPTTRSWPSRSSTPARISSCSTSSTSTTRAAA